MATESSEDQKSRINRELIEFLNELRVALPGVQVLFAFLLTVPFSQRFDRVGPSERRVYFASVLCTAVSSVLFIAPAAHHRLRFRSGNKEQLLKVGSVFAAAGMAFLAAGMSTAVYLISTLLYGDGTAALTVSALALLTLVTWFLVPLLYKSNKEP